MIVTRLDTRPASGKLHQVANSHCMTIINEFNQQPTSSMHRKKSSVALPNFAELPAKDFTQLFYSKFKVKGLPVEASRTSSKRHGSQKKLTTTLPQQPVNLKDVLRISREEPSLHSDFESFFRDGNASRSNFRPATAAKKTGQTTQHEAPSRPMTAVKQRPAGQQKDKLLSAEKQTRITASLSNSILLHDKSARTIYEKLTRVVEYNNFTINASNLVRRKIQIEPRIQDNSPIKGLKSSRKPRETLVQDQSQAQRSRQKSRDQSRSRQEEKIKLKRKPSKLTRNDKPIESTPLIEKPQDEVETVDLQELLKKATVRNQKHLRYLEDQQFEQYSKYLKAETEANNGHVPADIDRELQQMNTTVEKEDSQKLDYYEQLTTKIESVQDRLEQVLQNKTVVMDSRKTQPASQLLNLDEYEEVVRLFQEDEKDYNAIDCILAKLQPLKILSRERRLSILKLADLEIRQPDEIVIERGCEAMFIYMVVKGSLEKHEQQKICGMTFSLTKSIFDGETFGLVDGENEDSATQLKYEYSVVSQQQSTLLRVPYQQYMSIQSEFLKSELSLKVQALHQLQCFRQMPAKDLIPLATLLTDKRFGNGDIILREGTPVNKFYLMVKGSATIVKEEVVVRKKEQKLSSFAEAPFSHCNSINSIRRPVSAKKPAKFIGELSHETRNKRKYKLLAEDDKKIAYYYFHEFKDIRKGEQLVYRAVTAGLEAETAKTSHFEPVLKLSLISNCSDCEMFVLASEDVRKIPEYLLKPFLKYCSEHSDYDLFFDEQQNMKLKQWEQYKTRLCEQTMQDKRRTAYNGWMN